MQPATIKYDDIWYGEINRVMLDALQMRQTMDSRESGAIARGDTFNKRMPLSDSLRGILSTTVISRLYQG